MIAREVDKLQAEMLKSMDWHEPGALEKDWLAQYAKRTEREEEHLERIAHHYAQAASLVREIVPSIRTRPSAPRG